MKILAVDTALGACSCAILDNDRILAHSFVDMERGHAETLAPMVRDVMRTAGIDIQSIDRLAVTTGPGTFTGQRVGLAFMRGLRIALERPLMGVTTLKAMAAAALYESGFETAAAVHDARRGEVYFEFVSRPGLSLPAQVAPLEEVAKILAKLTGLTLPVVFCGTAAETVFAQYAILGGEAQLSSVRQPDAVWVAKLAGSEEMEEFSPLYLRAPDAKLPAV